MFSFRGHKTLKPRSKFISKNLFKLFNSELNGQKLEFNNLLTSDFLCHITCQFAIGNTKLLCDILTSSLILV